MCKKSAIHIIPIVLTAFSIEGSKLFDLNSFMNTEIVTSDTEL